MAKIMIVDDQQENLNFLQHILLKSGYEVQSFQEGKSAINRMEDVCPDLILLDVAMPEMDGYELCRILKSDDKTQNIPVIFISALNEVLDKIKAFEVGGADYITRPYEMKEVLARIQTHLEQCRLKNEILLKNKELSDSVILLKQMESQREKLSQFIVHDMRTPLMAAMGYLEMSLRCTSTSEDPMLKRYLSQSKGSVERVGRMATSLLDISRFEEGRMSLVLEDLDLMSIIEELVDEVTFLHPQLTFKIVNDLGFLLLRVDSKLIRRLIENLLENAVKHTPNEGLIIVSIHKVDQFVQISVADSGPGVPVEYQEKIFDKFFQIEHEWTRRPPSSGLGLTFCKHVVENHQGEIGVFSDDSGGSTFWAKLPIHRKEVYS